jgi:hypothetical protein
MQVAATIISGVGLLFVGAAIDRAMIFVAHARYRYNGVIERPRSEPNLWPTAVPPQWPAPDYRITHWENSFVFEDVIAEAGPRGVRYAAAAARAGWPWRSYAASSVIEERDSRVILNQLAGGADRPAPWLPSKPLIAGLVGNSVFWRAAFGSVALVTTRLARSIKTKRRESLAISAEGTAT